MPIMRSMHLISGQSWTYLRHHGVCFRGRETDHIYSVDLEVIAPELESVLVPKPEQFSSQLLQSNKGSYNSLVVFFDRKTALTKNTTYGIRASVLRLNSLYKANGDSFVRCSELSRFPIYGSCIL